MKKTVQKSEKNKKINSKSWTRLIFISLSLFILIFGFIMSENSFFNNYSMSQDYSDRYEAYVGVYNNKTDSRSDSQPNGDAQEGAEILSTRLNPMGMKDIRINVAGKNYLQVSASKNEYKSLDEFKNNIQKSGSVIMTDDTFEDIELSSKSDDKATAERTPISNYFTKASATTQTINSKKLPYISYELNGSNFADLISSKTSSSGNSSSEAQPMNLYIFTDLNKLFIDFRDYFDVDTKEYDTDLDKYTSYWNDVVTPIRDLYKKSTTSDLTSNVLYDLMRYKITYYNSDGSIYGEHRGSLAQSSSNRDDINSAEDLMKINSKNQGIGSGVGKKATFSFISDTNSYVYDANATSDDFKVDGKYGKAVSLYFQDPSGIVNQDDKSSQKSSKYKIDQIFNNLNSNVISIVNSSKNKNFVNYFQDNYLLFYGSLTSTQKSSESSSAFFSGNDFYTLVDTQSKAKIGASIFNAASAGFSFVAATVTKQESNAKSIEIILEVAILLILLLALMVMMIIVYRLLALFTIIVSLTSISFTLLILVTGFKISVGLDMILGIIILLGLTFEVSSLLFNLIRSNVFSSKRGIKTSYKIAAKDTLAFGIDIFVVLILSGAVMFWIGTNSLKSLAALLSIGAFISILNSLLFGSFLMYLVVKTNIFDNSKWLFILNIDLESRNVLREYILYRLESKKDKLIKKEKDYSKVDKKISKIHESVKKADERLQIKFEKMYSRQEVSVNKKINKIVLKKNNFISKDFKAKKIKKLNNRIEKINKSLDSLNIKLKDAKLDKIKTKIAKKIKSNNVKKLKLENINIKINNLKDIITNKFDLKIDELKYIISEEGHALKIEQEDTNTGNYSIQDRKKIKATEKTIKLGTKIVTSLFLALATVGIIMASTVGLNFDKSFGGAVVYTYWGSSIINDATVELTDIANSSNLPDGYKKDAKEILNAFKEEANPNNKNNSEYQLKTVKLFSEFLIETLEDKSILSSFFNVDLGYSLQVTNTYGLNYANGISQNSDSKWFSVEVNVKSNSDSVKIKDKVLYKFIPVSEKSTTYSDSGYVSKRLHPYTDLKMLIEFIIIAALTIAILFIYIFIRFKWTYYVALAISVLVSFAVSIAVIEISWITLDLSTIVIGMASFIVTLLMCMYTILTLRSVMSRKEIKSLTRFFEKQILVGVDIKNYRKNSREKIRNKHYELKLFKKTDKENIKKEDIIQKKIELKKYKFEIKEDLYKFKRIKNEEVKRESRKNNYLYEVVHNVFSSISKKLIFLSGFIVFITIAIAIGASDNSNNSLIILIDFIISSLVCLFVLIPIWVKIEGFRIYRKLSNKRFINQIEVSQEEQIVEDIND